MLEAAGYAVTVPRGFVCCGRPLYDFGWLDAARRRLQHSMRVLEQAVARAIPVVWLEPACVATFRDELLDFFPDDPRARRLSEQVFLLPEFLDQQKHLYLPELEARAMVHGHCHQKALMGMHSTENVLRRTGLNVEILDAGCCGMAGAFGFDPANYAVSLRIGEERLLPAVRAADKDTLIVADGYSCREQVLQGTGRFPLHTAEVLRLAAVGAARNA